MPAGLKFPSSLDPCAPAAATSLDRPPTSAAGPEAPQVSAAPAVWPPPPFVRAVAYGPYEGRMREAIHALKYDGLHPAARGLGKHARRRHRCSLPPKRPLRCSLSRFRCIASKHAERGFNQARLLAAEALSVLAQEPPDWRLTLAPSTLMRLRATESQAGLHAAPAPPQRARRFPRLRSRCWLPAGTFFWSTTSSPPAQPRALLRVLCSRPERQSVWVATLARAHRIDRAFDRSLVTSENPETSGQHCTQQ